MATTTHAPSAGIGPERSGANAVAESPAMRRLLRLARRISSSPVPVLVTGETGVGKEIIARLIHDASDRRKSFVPVNCAALPLSLAESELFGHARGAFTGAVEARKGLLVEADGGTLFLDEVGDMPPTLQAKFLRVLEDGLVRPVGASTPITVEVRVVSATNRNLIEEVRAGRFREDLYHRIVGVPLHVPPLRERPEDIPPLVEKFLAEATQHRRRPQIPGDVLEWLQAQPWCGNVRELRQAVQRAVALGGETLQPEDFQLQVETIAPPPSETAWGTQRHAPVDSASHREGGGQTPGAPYVASPVLPSWLAGKPLKEIEREVIAQALARHDGCLTAAARELGLARTTLYGKARAFGLRNKPTGGSDAS
jgi:transcriptional regulator with GAF, ATPase, and Fis domain